MHIRLVSTLLAIASATLTFLSPAAIALQGATTVTTPKLSVSANGTAFKSGESGVIAWGSNQANQATVPDEATSDVQAVAGGDYFSVALKIDGTLVIWGDNGDQVKTVPQEVATGVKAIAAGSRHILALTSSGGVVGWGDNGQGQLDIPNAAKADVIAISAGAYHSLALKRDGTVIAWGGNEDGQTTVPVTAVNVKAIAAGGFHSLALLGDGSVIAWGQNAYGQSTPPAEAASGVKAIAAGGGYSVALTNAGSVLAWGQNNGGQTTVPDTALSGVTAIAASSQTTLAIQTGGKVIAWGGDGRVTTIPQGALSGITAISAGRSHVLAIGGISVLDLVSGRVGRAGNPPYAFVLKNEGTSDLDISDLVIEADDNNGALAFRAYYTNTNTSAERLKETLAPGGVLSLDAYFYPNVLGPIHGTVTITSDDPSHSTFVFGLTGKGVLGEIAVDVNGPRTDGDSTQVDIGREELGGSSHFTMTVSNPSTTANAFTKITNITVPAGFRIALPRSSGSGSGSGAGTFPYYIYPGNDMTFDLYFEPTANTTYSGDIVITNDSPDPTDSFTIAITGTGATTLPPVAGYYGVLVGGKDDNHASISFTLTRGSILSGFIRGEDNVRHPFRARLPRGAKSATITLLDGTVLKLDFNDTAVAATLTEGDDTYTGKGGYFPAPSARPIRGHYTVSFDAESDGFGWAVLRVNARGSVRILGKLPNGSSIVRSQGTRLDVNNDVPVFLIGRSGAHSLLSGLLHFSDLPESDVAGTLQLLRSGTNLECAASGSLFTKQAPGLDPGVYQASVEGDGISFDASITLLARRINASTATPILNFRSVGGVFRMSFRDPALGDGKDGPIYQGNGVLLQKLGLGRGQFKAGADVGRINIGEVR